MGREGGKGVRWGEVGLRPEAGQGSRNGCGRGRAPTWARMRCRRSVAKSTLLVMKAYEGLMVVLVPVLVPVLLTGSWDANGSGAMKSCTAACRAIWRNGEPGGVWV